MEKEIWKEVSGWEGLYAVSNLGRIKSLRTKGRGIVKPNHILSQRLNRQGYPYVNLARSGKYKTVYVHRLVGIAFVENKNNYQFLNHMDGNKSNNNASNLEWVTAQENILHARETGLNTFIPNKRGEESAVSKLTENDVKEIRSLYSSGNYSQNDLAKKYNISQTTVWRVINRTNWQHVK